MAPVHRLSQIHSGTSSPEEYIFKSLNRQRYSRDKVYLKESHASIKSSYNSGCCRIEKVNSRRRALDVKVFRGFTVSSAEFISEHNNAKLRRTSNKSEDIVLTEEDAVNVLMKDYDKYGKYTKLQQTQSRFGQEVYFISIYNPNNVQNDTENIMDSTDKPLFERTNGVVGVVSAQLRQRSPFIAGSCVNSTNHTNPAVKIDFQHIYLANMRVEESLRRRGIGTTLLSAVVEHAKTLSINNGRGQNTSLPIVLSVDNDNPAALKMYEKFGFEYMEKNDQFCMMVFWT